jgi:hypothetical protein
MQLDSGTNPLRGGSITVDGIFVQVPENLLATLPALAVAWAELFDNNIGQAVGFEANVRPESCSIIEKKTKVYQVIGNTVSGKNIAGMIFIAQRTIQTLQGFIEFIDSNTGHFTVNGVDMVIDDPNGRYGPPTTTDELWASDPDNPSIHATNGFPVCIPTNSNTGTCPPGNRPTDPNSGKPLTSL